MTKHSDKVCSIFPMILLSSLLFLNIFSGYVKYCVHANNPETTFYYQLPTHYYCYFYSFQFDIQASDQSNPERTATANVIVTVVRDSEPPIFIRTPYSSSVLETAEVGTSFYRVTATDADLKVNDSHLHFTCLIKDSFNQRRAHYNPVASLGQIVYDARF